MTLLGILSSDIDEVWGRVEPMLAPAIARTDGRVLPEDVYQGLIEQAYQLWLVIEGDGIAAACVTTIITYPRKTYCRIEYVGGSEMKKWKHFLSDIEKWAKKIGCDGVETFARKGGMKVYENYNYKCHYWYIEKEF